LLEAGSVCIISRFHCYVFGGLVSG